MIQIKLIETQEVTTKEKEARINKGLKELQEAGHIIKEIEVGEIETIISYLEVPDRVKEFADKLINDLNEKNDEFETFNKKVLEGLEEALEGKNIGVGVIARTKEGKGCKVCGSTLFRRNSNGSFNCLKCETPKGEGKREETNNAN